MEKTIAINLNEIAENLAASYQYSNNLQEFLQTCKVYSLILGDETFKEVAKIAQQMINER